MRVLITDSLAEEGVRKLKEEGFGVTHRKDVDEEELVKIIPDYVALIIRSGTKRGGKESPLSGYESYSI